jgi:predicted transcriptional regulator
VPEYALTELQVDILKVLWARRQATVTDVQAALRPRRKLAHTTVATLLARMERKGVVAHDVDGREYVYRPTVDESRVRRSVAAEITDLAERLFAGDVVALVNQLLSEQDVKANDLKRVRELIEKREAALRRKAGRR